MLRSLLFVTLVSSLTACFDEPHIADVREPLDDAPAQCAADLGNTTRIYPTGAENRAASCRLRFPAGDQTCAPGELVLFSHDGGISVLEAQNGSANPGVFVHAFEGASRAYSGTRFIASPIGAEAVAQVDPRATLLQTPLVDTHDGLAVFATRFALITFDGTTFRKIHEVADRVTWLSAYTTVRDSESGEITGFLLGFANWNSVLKHVSLDGTLIGEQSLGFGEHWVTFMAIDRNDAGEIALQLWTEIGPRLVVLERDGDRRFSIELPTYFDHNAVRLEGNELLLLGSEDTAAEHRQDVAMVFDVRDGTLGLRTERPLMPRGLYNFLKFRALTELSDTMLAYSSVPGEENAETHLVTSDLRGRVCETLKLPSPHPTRPLSQILVLDDVLATTEGRVVYVVEQSSAPGDVVLR